MATIIESLQLNDLIFGDGTNTRTPVRLATTTAGTLVSDFENGDSIDGVALLTGDRILIKDQANPIENGIYVVQVTGAPSRDEDLISGSDANIYLTWAEEGTDNKATAWMCFNDPGSDVVGTDGLIWIKVAGSGVVSLPPGGAGVDNRIVRFDGTDGTIQDSTITLDDSGNMTGVGDITFDEATNDLTVAAADQGTGVATATIPDLGGTGQEFIMEDVVQTMTNKTLVAPVIQNNMVFDEATNDFTLEVTDQATAAVTATIPDLDGVAQDFVFTKEAQTLENKTLDNPSVINDIEFVEGSGTVTMAVTDQVDVTATIPDLGGVDQDFVFTEEAQTLSNKTLVTPVVQNNIVFDEATNDLTMTVDDQGTGAANANIPDLGGVSQDFVFTNLAQTLTNKTFGDNLNMGGNKIINVAPPTLGTDGVNKDYVDSLASGLDPKESVRVGTTPAGGDLGATYTDDNPDTLTGAPLSLDGVTLVLGDRVLVKDQTDPKENGIYEVTAVGATTDLQRAPDHDGTPVNEVSGGNHTFIENGTTQESTGWVVQGDGTLILNTDDIVWVQFSGSGTFNAGAGITKTGNVFSANVSNVTTGISSNNIVVRSNGVAGQVIRSTGTAGAEAAYGAIDLTNTNAVTGSLTVSNGGTGATSFTSGELLQGNGTGPVTSSGITAANVTTNNNTQTLSNKSLIDVSTHIIDDVDPTKRMKFQVAGVTTATTREFTVPDASTVLVGTDVTQTLSNKTLTEPRFADLGYIADINGNEMLIFDTVGSAVNNLQLANASSTNNPLLTAVGGDANVGLDVQLKGTGTMNLLATTDQQSQLRLFEDLDNGSNYVGIRTPAALAGNWILTLPPTDGTPGQLLQTDGTGVSDWVNPPSARVSYALTRFRIRVTNISDRIMAYHAWDNSEYTDLGATMRVVFWYEDVTNRNLIVSIHDGTSVIGSVTISSPVADGIGTFTVTKPTSDVRLEFRVRKSASSGISPRISGAQLEFTN